MFVKVFLVVVLVGPFQNALSDHPREYTSIQPYFEHSLYTKPFKDGKLEDLVVMLKYGNGYFPTIVEEEMNRYFEITEGSFKEEFIVNSKDNVWWDKYEDAIFTLEILDATPPVRTVVIVKRGTWDPPKLTHFEYSSYTSEFVDGILEEMKVRVLDGRGITPFVLSDEVPDINYYFEVVPEDLLFGEDQFVVKSKLRWDRKDAVFTLKIDDATLLSPAETVVIVKSQEIYPTRQPHFERSLYIAQFEDGFMEELIIKVIDGFGVVPIIAEIEIPDYFEVIVDSKFAEEVYIVRSRADMKWTSSEDAIFTLRIDDSALLSPVETVVIVKMNFRHADFEHPLYVSEFIHGILNPLFIRVNNDFGVFPQIKEEEMKKYFEVIATTTAGDYVVRSKANIRWTADEDAMFTLKIDDSSLYSPVETAVIVKKEKQVSIRPPLFEKSFYTAEFVDGILDDLKVKVIDGFEVVPIIAETEINDYFEVIVDSTFPEEVYIVKTKAGIKWTFDMDAIFTLRIDYASLVSSVETVVIVKKEEFQINLPRFEKSAYISEFEDGVLEEIKVKVLDSFGIVPNIVEKDLWNYFEVTYEYYPLADDEVIIRSINGIKWNKNQDAIFTLQIAHSSLNFPIETVVIVKWKEVACEQGDLVEAYRPGVRDVDSHVLTAIDMAYYGEPKIKAISENADKYTEILKTKTSLQVIIKDIQKFEETTASNKNAPSLRLELVNFAPTCTMQKVDFRIIIIDTNNNDPVFTDKNGVSKDTFEVNVPMYFPKKVESFEAIIYAKDVDLTNTKVTFSIEPEDGGTKDLDIEYGEVVDDLNKVHSAIIRSTGALNYQKRRYIVTVEDEGTKDEGKRTATGMITVKRNQEERVITLKFEKSSYTARLKDHRHEDLNL